MYNIYFLLVFINIYGINLFIIGSVCDGIFSLSLIQKMYIPHIPRNETLTIIWKIIFIIILRNFVFYDFKYIRHNYIHLFVIFALYS